MKKILILTSFFLLISCSNFTNRTLKTINSIYTKDKGALLEFVSEGAKIFDPWWQAPEGVDYTIFKYKNVKLEKLSKKANNNKVIYFIHGGAFVFPLAGIYRNLGLEMLNINDNYDIVFIDYSVYPDAFYPTSNIEVEKGFEFLKSKYEKVYVMGDSAGGNLAVSMTMKQRDEKKELADGLILISPFLDISNTLPSRVKNYETDLIVGSHIKESRPTSYLSEKGYFEKEENKKDVYISPVFGNFNNFPKTFIEVNEKEMLYDDSKIIKEKLEKEGVIVEFHEVKNLFHVYHLNTYMKESIESLEKIYKFLGN